jgi:hypothetical protein
MGNLPLYGNDWNVKRGQYGAMKKYLDNYSWHMGVKPEDLGFGDNVGLTIDPEYTNKLGANGMFRQWNEGNNSELMMAAPLEARPSSYKQRSWPSIFSHEMFHYQDGKGPVSELEKYVSNDKQLSRMFGDHWSLPEKMARGADEYYNLMSRPGPHSQISKLGAKEPRRLEAYEKENGDLGTREVESKWRTSPVKAGISQETLQEYDSFFNKLYPDRKLRY